jgi:Flp pilus assembly protein TadD
VLLDVNQGDEAMTYARKAVEIDHEDPFALDVLGLAYYKQGMLFEAAEALVKAVKLGDKKHEFILNHWLKIRNAYIQWKKDQS